MKALVLGARGAVGRVVAASLTQRGHAVTAAGRSGVPVGIDLSAPGGLGELERAASMVDVVVNASGIEDARLGGHTGSAPLVDISATASYLAALRATGGPVLLGAGLAPGLSTVLVASLETAPGDEVDVLVLLGSGEKHGAAAVAWTAGLIGSDIFEPAEGGTVTNLRSGLRSGGRRYLRADFPDHLLADPARGLRVRSYLTLSSALSTTSLALVARMPPLRGLIAGAPPLGSSDWRLTVVNRRTGRTLTASGVGQSETTGLLTALAAERVAQARPAGPIAMDEVVSLDDVLAARTPSGGRAVAMT